MRYPKRSELALVALSALAGWILAKSTSDGPWRMQGSNSSTAYIYNTETGEVKRILRDSMSSVKVEKPRSYTPFRPIRQVAEGSEEQTFTGLRPVVTPEKEIDGSNDQ